MFEVFNVNVGEAVCWHPVQDRPCDVLAVCKHQSAFNLNEDTGLTSNVEDG